MSHANDGSLVRREMFDQMRERAEAAERERERLRRVLGEWTSAAIDAFPHPSHVARDIRPMRLVQDARDLRERAEAAERARDDAQAHVDAFREDVHKLTSLVRDFLAARDACLELGTMPMHERSERMVAHDRTLAALRAVVASTRAPVTKIVVPAGAIVFPTAQHALDARVNYFGAQLLVESVERDLGERTMVMNIRGKTRALLVIVTPCAVESAPEPVHANTCDLDEDCSCAVASDRSDERG